MNHAGQGIAAPDGTLRTGQELDGRAGEGHQMGKVVLRTVGGVVDLHAVDEHQGVVGLRTAQAHLPHAAEAPGLADGQVGQLAQGIHAHRRLKPRFEAGDRQYGIVSRQPMGGDHQGLDFIRRLSRGGASEQKDRKGKAGEKRLVAHGRLHRSAHTRTDRSI